MQLLFVLLFIKKFFSTDIGLLYELGDIRRLMGKELFEVFSNGEPTWYLKQGAEAVPTWYLKRGAEPVNGKSANGEPTWYLKRGAEACQTRLSSAGHVPTWYLKRGAEVR